MDICVDNRCLAPAFLETDNLLAVSYVWSPDIDSNRLSILTHAELIFGLCVCVRVRVCGEICLRDVNVVFRTDS